MQQVFSTYVNDIDVEALYANADREPPADRPWIIVGMIGSADGAAATDGRSGGLGGSGDRRVFRALRAVPDLVLVAGGTVRAERYGPVRLSDAARAARRDRGLDEVPRLAIVSASLDLDWDGPLFATSDPPPLIITPSDAADDAVVRAKGRAEVLAVGQGRADLTEALAGLRRRGVRTVLCEGGPSLNGALLADDVIDEVALSLAPALVGGDDIRIIRGGAPAVPRVMDLAHALVDEGYLFLRYVRRPR